MKSAIFTILLFCFSSFPLTGEDTNNPNKSPQVVVNNASNGEFRVVARDNHLFLEGGGDTPLELSEPFSTPDTDWKPTGAVLCSWSPDGTYLAVFAPHPRATDITVVDLRKMVVLNETFSSFTNYPEWYNDVFSTQDSPGVWARGKLEVTSNVTLRDGQKRTMPLHLVINGSDFSLVTTDTDQRNSGQ